MLEQVSKFPSFLKLNNTSLYVYTTLCLSIHLPIDTWVISVFWLLRTMLLMDVISKDLFEVLLSVPLDSYPAWNCWITWEFCSYFLRICHAVFQSSCAILLFPPAVRKDPSSSTSSPTPVLLLLLVAILLGLGWYFTVALIYK